MTNLEFTTYFLVLQRSYLQNQSHQVKVKVLAELIPSLREECFPSPFLTTRRCLCSLAYCFFRVSYQPLLSVVTFLHTYMLWSVSSFFYRSLWFYWDHKDNPGRFPHLEIFNINPPARSPTPCKLTFTCAWKHEHLCAEGHYSYITQLKKATCSSK
jgi:hypothetical protein